MQTVKSIVVFGLGRIGLPLALRFCEANFTVYGIDIDQKRIQDLQEGRFPFMEKGGAELLQRTRSRFFPSTDVKEVVSKADTIVLTLGTAIDEHKNPDFSQVMLVIDTIKPYLRKGHHLVLRSTVSPEFPEYLIHHLNDATPLKVGRDLFLSYCPERIAEGQALEEISTIPQIVGADDEESRKKAGELFSAINKNLLFGSTKSAAAAKIICNMSRYIQFAIANDLDMWMQRLDINTSEAFTLANEGYKRSVLKKPGPTAGPCLVKDGNIAQEMSPMYQAAEIVNEGWPIFYSKKIAQTKQLHGKKVALLGTAFKADVDDDRASLSHKVRKFFEREYAKVSLHDPYLVPGNLSEILAGAEVVVVAVNHKDYDKAHLLPLMLESVHPEAIVWDMWNIFGKGWEPQSLFHYRD